MRYFALPGQEIIDFLGLNCHECVGRPAAELMNVFDPEYVEFFRQGFNDTFAYVELYSANPGRNTILGGFELVVAELTSPPPWLPE